MKKTRYHFFFFTLAVFFFSCSKNNETVIDPVPKISFLSINQNSFKEFKDSVIITIQYEDGDGDLGYENADLVSAFVHDMRLPNKDGFYIPPLAPLNNTLAISGKLNIVLPPLFLLSNSPTESTSFEIQLQDRKGNLSNIISTPEVTITR
jgi:hypothetical protein